MLIKRRHLARTDDWQIVHGTLMTFLMIFFMILFATYYTETESKYETIISSIQVGMGGEVDSLLVEEAEYREKEEEVAREFTASEGLKQFTRVEVDREKIKIIFSDPVIFLSGSANLKPETIWILGEIAGRLKLIPENKVIIEGHTDNVSIPPGGKFSSNWELSLYRSLSLIHYLTEVEGLDPKRFIPIGHGEHKPLFPNDTPQHRAQNRRIEISIIRKG